MNNKFNNLKTRDGAMAGFTVKKLSKSFIQ